MGGKGDGAWQRAGGKWDQRQRQDDCNIKPRQA